MANIASGYISIQFKESNTAAADEISRKIGESEIFSYGGDCDISHDDAGLEGGFSCRGTGTANWDWINEQLIPENSSLSDEASNVLAKAEISGYSYEWGCTHRDRVEKKSEENSLTVYESSFGDLEFADALKLVGSFTLDVGGALTEGNGVRIALLNRSEKEEDGVEEFEFEVSGDRTCVAKINFDTNTDEILCVTHFVYDEFEPEDEEEEESGADMDDFDGMNELLDDLLCERDELFAKCD